MEYSRWLRLFAIGCLMLCVYCKMIDLDCALNNPIHCQSLLESNDNDFAHFELESPLWSDPPVFVLVAPVIIPQCCPSPAPLPEFKLPPDPAVPRRQSPCSKRPPPQLA